MKAKELLKPRYKLIADYPRNNFKIGAVLDPNEDGVFKIQNDFHCYEIEFDNYRHLFRELKWWEERKEEDMPKRIGKNNLNGIFEVFKWDIETLDSPTAFIDRFTHQIECKINNCFYPID